MTSALDNILNTKTYSCPQCNAELAEGFKFCPSCKANLTNQCSCSKELQAGWKLCPYCGRPNSKS